MNDTTEKRARFRRSRERFSTPNEPPENTFGRILPHDLAAEQGLLGSCIAGAGELLPECQAQKITPEYFYDIKHQHIFLAITRLADKSEGIDEITLCNALRASDLLDAAGGTSYVSQLVSRIEVTAHAIHWLAIVREKYFLRRLITTAQRTVELAFEPADDIRAIFDKVEGSFMELSSERISEDNTQHIRGPINEAVETINNLQINKGAVAGVHTGFSDLDRLCFGFHPGQMIVVAARPGMGKTSIALNFIEAALFKGKGTGGGPVPTLMFSLEMPANELAMRLICSRASANLRRIRDGYAGDRLPDIADAAKKYQEKPFHIDDQGGQTILEIRAKARRIHRRQELGLIVIDYLQLINGTDNRVPREQQIAEASRSIKAMAKELKVPVIALAQLNRKSEEENRAPRMSDLRESGSIEQDADVVMLIDKKRRSKKEEENDDETGKDVWPRELIIAKQRNGPTGTVELLFRPEFTRFEAAAK
ncbi:MAG: replicative DNA helicase [Puniceicoccales bacterium]|jgi:replicative DNA helicase|nr:replicative DNA helicase [Puniceicoccales bacterium]